MTPPSTATPDSLPTPATSPALAASASPSGKAFFDTNVLVYAHDASAPRKREIARALLLEHLGADTLCTSTQVLAEYYSVVTRKGEVPLSGQAAAWLIEQLPAEAVVTPGLAGLRAASGRCAAGGLSIWDALIVEAALEAGATLLYTEDARLLRALEGDARGLRGQDPFAVAP
jgi:predicted nucleic acid-binding protein